MKKKKKKSSIGGFLRTMILLIALGVLCYSGYMLYTFYREYRHGSMEYENLEASFGRADVKESENLDQMEDEEYLRKLAARMEHIETGQRKPAAADFLIDEEEADLLQGPPETDLFRDETEGFPELAEVEEGDTKRLLPVMRNPINFTDLKAVNPDIRGWLKLRALDISYPVVQGEDNEFYLHRTFEKTDNFAGCLFMDARNQDNFSDQNTIIYGHNMKNGSMFGKLHRLSEEEVLKKGKFFWIFSEDMIYLYRIVAGTYVDEKGMNYKTVFTEQEFKEFLEDQAEHSQVPAGSGIESDGNRIITLSTCTGDEATRFVVIGQLAQEFVPEDRAEEYYKKLQEQETETEEKNGFWEQYPSELTWEQMSEQLPVIYVG